MSNIIGAPNILTGEIHVPTKLIGVIELPPEHIERNAFRFTGEYDPKSKPFLIDVSILESPLTQRYYRRRYFVRAPKPGIAGTVAARYWRGYEKPKGQQFPEVAGPTDIIALDEQDWFKYLKEMKRWPHHFVGPERNPGLFTYITDEDAPMVDLGNAFFTHPRNLETRDMADKVSD
jgi:hypothetical protein